MKQQCLVNRYDYEQKTAINNVKWLIINRAMYNNPTCLNSTLQSVRNNCC